ncbi:MAG: alanine--glyoxylate aminotransferase family protein [Anaerolineae bacterium]|nr:alanine--glyoxylate aminotransferase family protein [Anaerolineae bacterium]
MIPGPIEFDPAVLAAMGAPTTSHIAPDFIEVFGQALERMREVFLCPDGQPFIMAGSGTLAMDLAGANLIEPGDKALVVNTGYFGDRYGALLKRYGAEVTHVCAPVGGVPALQEVEATLKTAKFKLMTVTHVDTSTGVLTDVKALAALARQYETLIVVDGVCSVAGEELRMTEWGVDLALTASQKAIGVPPGLALFVAGPRALAAFKARTTPVLNFYADWTNWLPVMEAYEARKVAYFGTPAVNLIAALNVSLGIILKEGMEARFARHRAISRACKAAIAALGMGQVPLSPDVAANTMTAPRYPAGVAGTDLLPKITAAGVILAGGLHPEIKAEYFRIGHMGVVNQGDLLATIGALETGLAGCGYAFEKGTGVAAAMADLCQRI